MTETIEGKLEKLGITLPPTPKPMANYVTFAITGDRSEMPGIFRG